jgi:hypothetical protein
VPVIPPRGPRNPATELVTVHNLPMPAPGPMYADRPPAPRPMHDLTTTMPIIIPPMDEHGRHRVGPRLPRSVKVGGIFAVAVGVGIAVASSLGGSHNSPAADAQGGSTTPGAVTQTTGDTADAPTDPNATPPASADTSIPTARATKPHVAATTHPSTTPSPTPTSSPTPAAPPPPPVTTAATTPSASATFQALKQGMTGPAVAQMQQELLAGCYLSQNSGFQLGNFDRTTYYAVRTLQNFNPGTSTADGRGVFGAATAAALQANPHGICQ